MVKKNNPVAGWLELVMLVHVPLRTEGGWVDPWFRLGSCRWILGEFSSGVYPTVSHLRGHGSKFKPVTRGEFPSISVFC